MKTKKPELVKVGKHYINVNDISCISQVRCSDEDDNVKTLYVVRFISNPNPEYACWVEKKDLPFLLEHFEVKVSD